MQAAARACLRGCVLNLFQLSKSPAETAVNCSYLCDALSSIHQTWHLGSPNMGLQFPRRIAISSRMRACILLPKMLCTSDDEGERGVNSGKCYSSTLQVHSFSLYCGQSPGLTKRVEGAPRGSLVASFLGDC